MLLAVGGSGGGGGGAGFHLIFKVIFVSCSEFTHCTDQLNYIEGKVPYQ